MASINSPLRGNTTKLLLAAKGDKFRRVRQDCLSSYFVDITRPLGQVQKGRLACDVVHKDDALENREQLKDEFCSGTWRQLDSIGCSLTCALL